MGSGVFVAADLVLTNAHVLCPAGETIRVGVSDERSFDGEVLRRDDRLDLALVRATGANVVPMPLGDVGEVAVGDKVMIVGSPVGLDFTVQEGSLSSLQRSSNGVAYLQLDAKVSPGNSGGPVIDAQGRAVGIVSMKVVGEGVEGIGLALPINYAYDAAQAYVAAPSPALDDGRHAQHAVLVQERGETGRDEPCARRQAAPGHARSLPTAAPPPPEAVPSSLGTVHAGDVEKRRLELTQGLKNRLQTGRLSLLTGSRSMDVEREVDLADILRFVARRLEHDAAGLTVLGLSGAPRRLVWPELSEVWARRLPPEPPWAQALIVELVPVRGAPVRILASTAINFRGLPGGAAPSRNENLRKLLVLARSEQPSLTADPATTAWMDRAEAPPVLNIRQLAERDVRFA